MEYGEQVRRGLEERYRQEAIEQARIEARNRQEAEDAALQKQHDAQEAGAKQILKKKRHQNDIDAQRLLKERFERTLNDVSEIVRGILQDVTETVPQIYDAKQKRVLRDRLGFTLEWGNKLEPTPREKKVLKQKVKMEGAAGWVQRARAPDSIIEYDKNMIHVPVNSHKRNKEPIVAGIGAKEFLDDPGKLIPNLISRIAEAKTAVNTLTSGQDYLRDYPYRSSESHMGGVDGGTL